MPGRRKGSATSENNVYVCGSKAGDIDIIIKHVNDLRKDVASAKPDLEQLEAGKGPKPSISAKQLCINTANHRFIACSLSMHCPTF